MESTSVYERERVWLVANSTLWVAGFKGLFGDPCGVDVVVLPLAEAIALKGPEIVLIDSGASSLNGKVREVIVQFRRWAPELRPIVVSPDAHENELHIESLIRSGAKGYLTSSASVDEFRAAIDNVRDGSIWAPRRVLSRLVLSSTSRYFRPSGSHRGHIQFTPREDQVIKMLVAGKSNVEIGESLGIDAGTVKGHLGRIMRKAGVGNRVELTMFALGRDGKDGSSRESVDRLPSQNDPQRII
jgi:DNA-binding NarL/FixJ family response regulator